MSTATVETPRTTAEVRVEGAADPVVMGHDLPCPWCGHSHHFLPCEDCACGPHPHYPGEA